MLGIWFLYSNKNSYIINEWLYSILKYYKINDSVDSIFIHHYLFRDLYKSNEKFKNIWDEIPKLPVKDPGPHYWQQKGTFNIVNDKIIQDISNKITPLYKLSLKRGQKPLDKNLNLYYLYSTIDY